MNKNTIALLSKAFCFTTIILVIITTPSYATTTTTNQDLNLSKQNASKESIASNRKTSYTSARSGRMLDLDHLAGDIGKEEKLAKERSLSGQRQSRILSEDILAGKQITTNEGTLERSRKANSNNKNNKKMAIKGFIPIISLEGGGAKEGKHFENAMEALNGNNDNDDQDEEQDNNNNNNNSNDQTSKEHLLSSYGGQTSIGHATFGLQPTTNNNNEQQQWQQYNSNNNNNYDQTQEVARHKKLLGGTSGILGGLGSLSMPGKRFVSSLVPSASTTVLGHPQQQLQAPMNLPINQQSDLMNGAECVCVPFYQCKGGYLTEAQLTKSSPLSHLFANQHQQQLNPFHNYQQQQQQPQFALGHQVPRSLNFNDVLQQQQQQQISNTMNQLSQPEHGQNLEQQQQQNVNDLIYEQLKKSIDSSNLEQQLLLQQQQQQPSYVSIDERSKSGNQQRFDAGGNSTTSDNNNNNQTTILNGEDVFERSLLNPLGRRQSIGSQHKSCGIMRTCCKLPPTLINNPNRLGYQYQQQAYGPRFVNNNFNRPIAQNQPQYQLLQPAASHQSNQLTAMTSPLNLATSNNNMIMDQFINNQQDYLSATSSQSPSMSTIQQQQQQQQQSQQQQQQQSQHLSNNYNINNRPFGGGSGFMAGRCGLRSTMGISGRVQNAQPMPGSESTAEFGEFPSHVAILKRLSPGDSMFVCSGVLISNQWVATAAHCVRKQRSEELKVRLGEWDVNRDDEFYPFVETNIRDIVLHPDFQPSSLINDLALLRLEQPIDGAQMPHIAPACLPAPDEHFNQQRCWVAGWGKDAFGQHGTFQSVLKKVDLPVVKRLDCENALRFETKLGKFFRLHPSALCAGGERGKDACEGDGGAGLYCIDPDTGLTKVAGLVSWGVGCGQKGVPGVYTNLAYLSNWIEQFVASSGEENLYMDRNSNQLGPDNSFKNIISERSNHHVPTITTNTTAKPNHEEIKTIIITNNNSTSNSSAIMLPPGDSAEEIESRAG